MAPCGNIKRHYRQPAGMVFPKRIQKIKSISMNNKGVTCVLILNYLQRQTTCLIFANKIKKYFINFIEKTKRYGI
jgi:hypothetical protein